MEDILLQGQKIWNITILDNSNKKAIRYRCDCGRTKVGSGYDILLGKIKSCGCRGKNLDIFSKKFGKLIPVRIIHINKKKLIECKCDCGSIVNLRIKDLTGKHGRKSCGCTSHKERALAKVIDITDKRFGILTAIKRVSDPNNGSSRSAFWLFKCDCGNEIILSGASIRRRKDDIKMPRSCGCIKRKGIYAPTWNPNLTDEDRKRNRITESYIKWRGHVYRNHKYTCAKCFNIGYKYMAAHHIENYKSGSNENTNAHNGVLLCKKCHIMFHSIYGNKNNNLYQMVDYTADSFKLLGFEEI